MKVLLQRVREASVSVKGTQRASIQRGLLLFIGVEEGDNRAMADSLAKDVISFRIFPDEEGNMNRSLQEVGGELLVIPNFTLCARTETGNRPGFGPAAHPDKASTLFDYFVETIRSRAPAQCHSGIFGAHMEVDLRNDGPVTFMLSSS